MTRVLMNDTLWSMLHNLSQPLELCDEAGNLVGRVFPTVSLSEYEPQVSEEELDRRENANEKRYTTAEVLAYLEKL